MGSFKNPFDNELNEEAILQWLQQFEENERPIILRLLENFNYYSIRRIKSAVIELYDKLSNTDAFDLEETSFVPVGYVAKSGSVISYFFRTENKIPQSCFLLSNDIDKVIPDKSYNIIFLDDFIGTGHQAIQVWQNVIENRNLNNSNINYTYAVLVAFRKGKENIEKNTGFSVLEIESLNEKDLPLSDANNIFKNKLEKKES